MHHSHYISAGVIGVFSLSVAIYLYLRRRYKKEWRQVATVSGIRVYPVKGCKGIELTIGECTAMGIKNDRHIAILDATGVAVTQRAYPRLALITQEFQNEGRSVLLTSPGMEPLEIFLEDDEKQHGGEKVEYHLFGLTGDAEFVSEEADQWMSRFLGREGFRVVRFPSFGSPRRLVADKKYGSEGKATDAVAFSDQCPYLMISEASLADLNSRYEGSPLPMARFRPNIIIKECRPYLEDGLKQIQIGSAEFRGLHRCGRCTATTINPDTGVKAGNEPLATLRTYRLVPKEEDSRFGNAPVFGKNLGLAVAGTISVGDPVYSLE